LYLSMVIIFGILTLLFQLTAFNVFEGRLAKT
jgi:hypothetical protein